MSCNSCRSSRSRWSAIPYFFILAQFIEIRSNRLERRTWLLSSFFSTSHYLRNLAHSKCFGCPGGSRLKQPIVQFGLFFAIAAKKRSHGLFSERRKQYYSAVDNNQGNGYSLYFTLGKFRMSAGYLKLFFKRYEWKLIWMLNRMTTYGNEENSQFFNFDFQFCQLIVQRRRCNPIETFLCRVRSVSSRIPLFPTSYTTTWPNCHHSCESLTF